jgi:hypothetical protein
MERNKHSEHSPPRSELRVAGLTDLQDQRVGDPQNGCRG